MIDLILNKEKEKETMKTISKTITTDSIDFRTSKPQKVNLPFDGEVTIIYVGRCPVTGTRLYESTGSNDPRGPLGWHAVTDFVASEYDMEGPTMAASWIACNNDRAIYEKALSIAKSRWTKKDGDK